MIADPTGRLAPLHATRDLERARTAGLVAAAEDAADKFEAAQRALTMASNAVVSNAAEIGRLQRLINGVETDLEQVAIRRHASLNADPSPSSAALDAFYAGPYAPGASL